MNKMRRNKLSLLSSKLMNKLRGNKLSLLSSKLMNILSLLFLDVLPVANGHFSKMGRIYAYELTGFGDKCNEVTFRFDSFYFGVFSSSHKE